MAPLLVFLHGVGDGDPRGEWLTHLNTGLEKVGYRAIAKADTIAPRYSSFLSTDGINASLPGRTYATEDEDKRRREYERRQARVSRLIGHDPDAGPFGLDALPDAALGPLQERAVAWARQLR